MYIYVYMHIYKESPQNWKNFNSDMMSFALNTATSQADIIIY